VPITRHRQEYVERSDMRRDADRPIARGPRQGVRPPVGILVRVDGPAHGGPSGFGGTPALRSQPHLRGLGGRVRAARARLLGADGA